MTVTRKRTIVLSALVAFCGATGMGWAQNAVSDAQNKLLARRAAEADCYRKLAETVYGVKISSDTYVRDFITESDEIRSAVDAFVKGVRLGQPRYYDDGVCEVDAEVTVAKLVTRLKEIHTTHYEGNLVHTTDFESIKQTIQSDVIRVTGSGAPRPELPPGLPAGVEDIITPLPPNYSATLSIPAIWKTVGPQARLMAKRAAELDAMRKLLEQIKGLRLTSDTLVRDFITESDEISTKARGIVIGAGIVSEYYHGDELIVEVTMEVPVEKIITRIKELHTEYYHGNSVTTTDIINVKKRIQRNMIAATGSGVPPAKFLDRARSSGVEMPTWMGERIEAVGQGTDSEFASAQGRLRAARAATADAMRKLGEQIQGLQINANTMVRDFVTESDVIASQMNTIISGAIVGTPTFADGMATVSVSIPAANVWRVVHQEMQISERHGS